MLGCPSGEWYPCIMALLWRYKTRPLSTCIGWPGGTESVGFCWCMLASCILWCQGRPSSFLVRLVSRKRSIPFQLHGEAPSISPLSWKGWISPLPWHRLAKEGGRHPQHHSVQWANTHWQITCTSNPTIWCTWRWDWSNMPIYNKPMNITLLKNDLAKEEDYVVPPWSSKADWLYVYPKSFIHSVSSPQLGTAAHTTWHDTREKEASYAWWWSHTHY